MQPDRRLSGVKFSSCSSCCKCRHSDRRARKPFDFDNVAVRRYAGFYQRGLCLEYFGLHQPQFKITIAASFIGTLSILKRLFEPGQNLVPQRLGGVQVVL